MTTTTMTLKADSAPPTAIAPATLEKVVIGGDLSALSSGERVSYYLNVCRSVGLNPATRPFEYLRLNGKLVLYARKDATDQLRQIHGVSITKLECERLEDVYVVRAHAKDARGREDVSTGAVPLGNLKGELLANATMKAETKAKRRVTLSICGLGLLDESEVGSIRDAEAVTVNTETGEIVDVAGAIEDTKKRRGSKVKPDATAKANAEFEEAKLEVRRLLVELGSRLKVDAADKDAWSQFVKAQKMAANVSEKVDTIEEMELLAFHLRKRLLPEGANPTEAVDPKPLPDTADKDAGSDLPF